MRSAARSMIRSTPLTIARSFGGGRCDVRRRGLDIFDAGTDGVIPYPEYSIRPLTCSELLRTVRVVRPLRGDGAGRKGMVMDPMRLTKIAGGDDCRDGDCPAVYRTDHGTIAVQGGRIALPTPDYEAIVEIPLALLTEAVRALGG
jgi:hypothetical protein